jgi:hypothetical protein
MNILPKIVKTTDDSNRQYQLTQKILRHHAQIGGKLFGPIPKNHVRQFFNLDERSWVWHESWKDDSGKQHSLTTRYDVLANGVFKSQNGGGYQSLSDTEATNLARAAELYLERVTLDYNNRVQPAA